MSKDWMEKRIRVTTVGELREALTALADDLQMELLGFYDDGFGIGRDVSVGIEISQAGQRYFAIDVEDKE